MKPYWQSEDGAIQVYHARCEDVIAAGCVPVDVSLIHDDPPYGIEWDASGRIGRPSSVKTSGGVYGREWGPIVGDDRPFDPAPILALGRPLVTWGANHYASRLPDSGGWIVWDKKRSGTAGRGFTGSDCELAWSNIGGCVSLFSYFWDGFRRDGEVGEHLHPTQKPKALVSFVFRRAKLSRGDLVFVPHAGSLPEGPVCQAMGLRLIACEVERQYCDVAVSRLGAITAERAAEPVGPLFGAPEKP